MLKQVFFDNISLILSRNMGFNVYNKQTSNFKLLADIEPELAEFGKGAEYYIYSDIQSSLVKLRCFSEKFVAILYRQLHLKNDANISLIDRMNNAHFKESLPIEIHQKLHLLRMKGNHAAHGSIPDNVNEFELIGWVREAYLLGKWLYISRFPEADYPHFEKPIKHRKVLDELEQANLNLQAEIEKLKQTEQKLALKAEKLQSELEESQLELVRQSQIEKYQQATAKTDLEPTVTLSQFKLIDAYNEYQLTDGQKTLVAYLEAFLQDKQKDAFLLKGYAGTGKTFIIKGFTDYLDIIGRNYMLAAPTGKAAKVLGTKTGKESSTIHKAIYSVDKLVEYRDESQPDTYKFYTDFKVNDKSADCIFIVDESSMISDSYMDGEFIRFGSGYLLKDLLKFINIDQNNHNKKIIFIGDDAQLPPVQMSYSPALNQEYLNNHFNLNISEYELTDIVRQKADSGILKNTLPLRKSLQKKVFNKIQFDINNKDIFEIKSDQVLPAYLQACNNQINNEAIVIAYSNRVVNEYNLAIRQHFFPNQKKITAGDKVMACRNKDHISNGDFGLVKWVSSESEIHPIKLKRKNKKGAIEETIVELVFRDVSVGFRNETGKTLWEQRKIIENLLYSSQPTLSSDENKALYIDFCIRHPELSMKKNPKEFKSALMGDPYFNALQLKFGYAITCHKAQGSEWNKVFVNCKAHKNECTQDYFRWIYTAITRTAKNLYLIEPPNIGITSKLKIIGMPDMLEPPITEITNQKSEMENEEILDLNPLETIIFKDLDENLACSDVGANLSGISKQIFKKITALLPDLTITQVEPNYYHDIYQVKFNNEMARFKVHYNGKQRISKVIAIKVPESLQWIMEQLSALENQLITNHIPNKEAVKEIHFMEDFLNEFHQLIASCAEKYQFNILDCKQQSYNQRYSFEQQGKVAVIDFWYNGKQQMTTVQPQPNLSDKTFLSQVIQWISEVK
ncbi:AAA family ATPase [Mannheimia sp. AT1]|uniref:AAA family ATPase n=1 Tax=Mannheimia cairinae TaxID=3025936 RepID=A0ABT5MTH4_9PAST|nr:AAA family ATPase [Mannheimia cairinae]MDD0824766.1 AAA family ATPase [Mannheimia cairinae]MDD0826304.1 AAA family ATPase [Mannheimia cairinae]